MGSIYKRKWRDTKTGEIFDGETWWIKYYRNGNVMGNTKSPRETLEKIMELAKKALAMDDSIAAGHSLLGALYSHRDHEKAIAEGERALALNPGGTYTVLNYASSLRIAGRPEVRKKGNSRLTLITQPRYCINLHYTDVDKPF